MNRPLLTPAARRHLARLAGALTPHLARLERDSAARLRQRPYDAAQIKAFLAITPGAFARLRSVRQFLEQVEYHGRRLAKLNVPPGEVSEMLRELEALLEPLVGGRFDPAREQLQLATTFALHQAFYQVREAESQAFFGLYRAEAESQDLEDLLGRFVRILTRTFHASAGRLLLLDSPADPKLMRPRYIRRGQAAERLIVDPSMRGRHASYWSYPFRPAALVQLGFPSPYPWLPREQALLDAVGARCAKAIERARLEEHVRRLEAAGRRAEEEERHRIGRELHDEAGQALLLLRLQLEMMEREAPAALARRLREARGIAEKTVDELRRIVAALSPEVLERLGLESALRQLAGRFQKMHSARLRLRIGKLAALAPPVEQVIYRVAQECLQNIAKHSQASAVNLLLQSADQSIRLSVSDNGAGFCAERAWSKTMSFGLSGMRERATTLGGTLTVRSAPGKGARIVLSLPLGAAAVGSNGKNSRIID